MVLFKIMKKLNRRDALILDDFAPYTESLRTLLSEFGLFDSIDCFTDENILLKQLKEKTSKSISYLFLDYYLSRQTLPVVLKRIKQVLENPKIIIISGITNPILLRELLIHNPDGIVHKADKPYTVIECIENIVDNKVYYSPSVKKILEAVKPSSLKNPFTKRETELLSFWARGYTVDQTSHTLFLSPHTVISHRKKMFRKAKCSTIEQLLFFAKKNKLID